MLTLDMKFYSEIKSILVTYCWSSHLCVILNKYNLFIYVHPPT